MKSHEQKAVGHTAGPWEIGCDAAGEKAVVTAECRDICTLETYYRDHEANARLISQAPAMLEALENAYGVIRDLSDYLSANTEADTSAAICLANIRAIIARAKGEA